MKKSLFLLFASFSFAAANAQQLTSKKGESYLPEKGDWAISVNAVGIFNWIGNVANNTAGNTFPTFLGGVNDYGIPGGVVLVGKQFTSDKNALRVIAGVNIGNITTSQDAIIGGSTNTNKVSTTALGLTAGLGKEWRRGKTRLQGYYGADVYLNVNTTTTTTTNSLTGVGNKEVKVANGFGLGLGGNGFIGAEYFLFPKMAIGAQYQAGLNINLTPAITTTTTPWAGAATEVKTASTTSIGVGPVGIASIRLTLHF